MVDNTVGARILKLRTGQRMNQEEFGKNIGLTKSAVSKIEKGWAMLTEKNAILICQKFGVNEAWLLRGEGKMFKENPEADVIMSMLNITDPLDYEIVHAYLKLDEKYRAAFRELLKELIGR